MNIGIIDADVIGKNKHRFPNLACMKISSFYKSQGHNVQLVTNYTDLYYDKNLWTNYQNAMNKYIKKQSKKNNEELGKYMIPCFDKSNIKFDKIFISKVFTDTEIDEDFLTMDIVEYGGTGFFYDKAVPLPYEIEHCMPDYHLYDDWVNEKLYEGIDINDCENEEETKEVEAIIKRRCKEFTYYLDYSIGFTTRGCIRGCSFCVNKNYRQCLKHSPVSEFLDESRPYICLLDDNVLSCKDWKEIFEELNATDKRFQFKQGMDERLLTDEKCEVVFSSNWIGDYIFAFDNIKDRRLVERKLQLIRQHTDKIPKFYCFCAYNHESPDTYPDEFWAKDIEDLLERVKILMSYHALPYVMRYADYIKSPYKTLYNSIAAWCNQPSFFKKTSFREYCVKSYKLNRKSLLRSLEQFEADYPDVAKKYFDLKWDDYNK